jgi:hypothetical protein
MNPVVRWTIGNVSNVGIKSLNSSIKSFVNIYKDKFKYYVCYNQINFNKISFLKKYKVNFVNQQECINSLKVPPIKNNPCWKIYPPRINKNVHEIFIDNDLIIYKKIDIIDFFLEKKFLFIITEAYKKRYGIFDNFIDDNFIVNTGFFGLPPSYEFEEDLNKNLPNWIESKNHFDEQGLIAFILMNKEVKIINLNDINVCIKERINLKGKYGMHFVGINKNKNVEKKIKKLIYIYY